MDKKHWWIVGGVVVGLYILYKMRFRYWWLLLLAVVGYGGYKYAKRG